MNWIFSLIAFYPQKLCINAPGDRLGTSLPRSWKFGKFRDFVCANSVGLNTMMARVSIPLVGLVVFCTLMVSSVAFQVETSEYTVFHEHNDYELRLYNETVWAVAKLTMCPQVVPPLLDVSLSSVDCSFLLIHLSSF